MNDADRDRMTTLIALVLIGVPMDDAVALPKEVADALLAEWRNATNQKAN